MNLEDLKKNITLSLNSEWKNKINHKLARLYVKVVTYQVAKWFEENNKEYYITISNTEITDSCYIHYRKATDINNNMYFDKERISQHSRSGADTEQNEFFRIQKIRLDGTYNINVIDFSTFKSNYKNITNNILGD